jgi:hypothetical protein
MTTVASADGSSLSGEGARRPENFYQVMRLIRRVGDSNRTCGMAAEIIATAVEEMRPVAPPRRVTRPDAAVLGFSPEADLELQPSRQQLADAVLQTARASSGPTGARCR